MALLQQLAAAPANNYTAEQLLSVTAGIATLTDLLRRHRQLLPAPMRQQLPDTAPLLAAAGAAATAAARFAVEVAPQLAGLAAAGVALTDMPVSLRTFKASNFVAHRPAAACCPEQTDHINRKVRRVLGRRQLTRASATCPESNPAVAVSALQGSERLCQQSPRAITLAICQRPCSTSW